MQKKIPPAVVRYYSHINATEYSHQSEVFLVQLVHNVHGIELKAGSARKDLVRKNPKWPQGGKLLEKVESELRELRCRAITLDDQTVAKSDPLLRAEGELSVELKDGRKFILRSSMTYQVGSGAEPHNSSTQGGARLLIVD